VKALPSLAWLPVAAAVLCATTHAMTRQQQRSAAAFVPMAARPLLSSTRQTRRHQLPARSTQLASSKGGLSMMFESFTEKAIKVIMAAQEESRFVGHNYVGAEQLLLGLLSVTDTVAFEILKRKNIKLQVVRGEIEKLIGRGNGFVSVEIPFTPQAKGVLERSLNEARNLEVRYIDTEHLLLALLKENSGVVHQIFRKMQIDPQQLSVEVTKTVMDSKSAGAAQYGKQGGGQQTGKAAKTPTLRQYGIDITDKAMAGEIDPVVGRQTEVDRVTVILGRRTKSNPVLIGEPGVGKTAIAEGLAQKIANNNIPKVLEGKRVVQLDMGLMIAGAKYRGEFEERLRKVLDEVKRAGNILLVIDEVHTLVGAGAGEGALDAANLLKPALARGEIQVIGTTTLDEYRKYIQKDAALDRRFQPVLVEPPSVSDTVEILRALKPKYEKFHHVQYSDEALQNAATLAHQHIQDRFLPDKAIDLLDEAGAAVKLQAEKLPPVARGLQRELRENQRQQAAAVSSKEFEKASQLQQREQQLKRKLEDVCPSALVMPKVDSEAIARVLAGWTGITVQQLTQTEATKYINMEQVLQERVIGQGEAIKAVSKAVRRAKSGVKNPDRPIASLLFCGPTGVGKTELTKALAEFLFDSDDAMIRLDMSEYMERHEVSKLIGAPPGYVGYQEGGTLTEQVRRKPFSVILFDEVEKAHPDVFNLLLQILEDGRLTDSKGRTVDFRNSLVIMTSNLGAKLIERAARVPGGGGTSLGFSLPMGQSASEAQYEGIRNLVNEELKNYFRPEFLNRLDETIVFRPLSKEEVGEIADVLLQQLYDRITETRSINMQVTDRMRNFLVDQGYDPSFGARPLRRAITRILEDTMAEMVLSGAVNTGDSVVLDVDLPSGMVMCYNTEGDLVGSYKSGTYPSVGGLPQQATFGMMGGGTERYERYGYENERNPNPNAA